MTARLPVQDNAAAAEAASVKISSKKATLIKGQNKTLKISGTKSKVTWSSSKKSVATVDAKGNVKAVGPGTAVITAKAGTKSAKCTVNLHTPAGQAYHRPGKVWRAYLASLNACRLSGGGLSE